MARAATQPTRRSAARARRHLAEASGRSGRQTRQPVASHAATASLPRPPGEPVVFAELAGSSPTDGQSVQA